MEKFKAVFFDLDGTLLYTLPDIALAVNHSLAMYGFPPFSAEEYRNMVGWGLTKTIRMAVPAEVTDPEILDRVRREMLDEYRRNPVVESAPYSGIREMLDELQSQGVPMAIISNKEDPITQRVVRQVFGEYSFLEVIGSSERFPPKPDPAGVNYLLERAGVPADRILFVGDTAMDMETAGLIGAFPVGVSWGYRSVDELKKAGARRIVDNAGEITELVRGKVPEGQAPRG